ncbi:MAG: YetF domain-containing protein [Peptococcales bacterium]|jgi:uncharacterized membrane protein YcaP (DUF421 family)
MDVALFWRIPLAFLALWLGLRLLGKKEIGQLTYYNFATSAAAGTLTASLAIDKTLNPVVPLIALLVFFGLSNLFSKLALRSYTARKILDGEPTLVVSKGKILEKNLSKLNLSTDNLMAKLREKNAFNVADVEFAVMEVDGKLSTLLKSDMQPVTPRTLTFKVAPVANLPADLIKDGNFVEENLRKLGLSKNWVTTQLQNRNLQDLNDIVLAQIDSTGQIYVDLKNDN